MERNTSVTNISAIIWDATVQQKNMSMGRNTSVKDMSIIIWKVTLHLKDMSTLICDTTLY
jgi:hypothetical protein